MEDRIRDVMRRSSQWRVVHAAYNPRLGTLPGEAFSASGFDEEYWGVSAPGALELWFSERGERRRIFRTGDAEAFLAKVVLDGLGRQGKLFWRAGLFSAWPSGFQIRALPGDAGIEVEWGEGSWAEFPGSGRLAEAVEFCHFLNASPTDTAATIASNDGAPLLQRSSRPEPPGPPRDVRRQMTVESWKRWLCENGRNA